MITFKELDGLVNAFARALREIGIQPGDKVALCLPNIPQVLIANYAVFRLGAIAVQNNPLYTERELKYQLNDSDSKIVITLTLLIPRIQKPAVDMINGPLDQALSTCRRLFDAVARVGVGVPGKGRSIDVQLPVR